jgi:hypothetical protein
MNREWFQHKNATRLDIYSHKIHEDKMVPDLVIEDSKVIKSLMDRIEQLPADGDQMKSFDLDTEEIDLCFYYEGRCQQIEIYRGKFKTPSTGFNSTVTELETKLYTDISSLLFPASNKLLLKIEGLELSFKDFSITYKGSEFHDLAPATVSFTKNKFSISDKNNIRQQVEITSGQLPPQPLLIQVDGFKIELLTHQTKDQQRLYPDYFQIIAAIDIQTTN